MKDDAIEKANHSHVFLLSRPHPKGYLDEWSRRLRQLPEEEVVDSVPVLVFRIHREWLALKATDIAEITSISSTHKIPHKTNRIILGITNISGELEIQVSLEALLEFDEGQTHHHSHSFRQRTCPRMLMMTHQGEKYVTKVSEIYGVLHCEIGKIKRKPVELTDAFTTHIKGVFPHRKFQVNLLDIRSIYRGIHNANSG